MPRGRRGTNEQEFQGEVLKWINAKISRQRLGLDKATQEKIDVVKSRLIRNYGYCEICSTDVLSYVASIFARGDVKKK